MSSPNLAAFVFKACVDRIEKYEAGGEDADALLELSEWLASFRRHGTITDAQLDALADMLGIQVDVPDAPDTYEEELDAVRGDVADVQGDVADHGDALADLSTTVSEQGEEVAGQGDAIAELSEIVSGLVPAEEE